MSAYNLQKTILGNVKKPSAPAQSPPPPPAPTIDTAAMSEENSRKFRRRKGVRANVTGASAQTPTIATKQLLG